MTVRDLIEQINELNDETIMDREVKYFSRFYDGKEIIVPINAIGLSYTEFLLAEQCPDCSKEVQECINNIYKAEED